MSKWYANVAHMTQHMNMMGALLVGGPGPGPLAPPKSGADSEVFGLGAKGQGFVVVFYFI